MNWEFRNQMQKRHYIGQEKILRKSLKKGVTDNMKDLHEILPMIREDISEETIQRIKKSVSEGIVMNENNEIKVSKSRKFTKKSIAFIAAAAIAVTTAISAGAAAVVLNRDIITKYFGEETVSTLESMGEIKNIIAENEHFRVISVSKMCNGYQFNSVMTFEGKDEIGKEYLISKNFLDFFDMSVYSEKTGKEINEGTSCWHPDEFQSGTADCVFSADLLRFKDEKNIIFKFSNLRKDKENKNNEENLFEGIELKIDTSANFTPVMFKNDDGDELYLSQIGFDIVSKDYYKYDYDDGEIDMSVGVTNYNSDKEIKFITEKGEDIINSEDLFEWNFYSFDNKDLRVYCNFKNLMDIDDITAVEIDGIKYTK